MISYTQDVQSGQIRLLFDDDSTAICDVLVGCDGIKSLVRAQMLRQMAENGRPELLDLIDPIFSGTVAYRGLISLENVPRDREGRLHRAAKYPMMV